MSKERFGLFDYFKLRKEYNSLLNKYETLLEMTEDKCFDVIYEKLNDNLDSIRLKKENKKLRLQVKTLKEIVRGEDDGKGNVNRTKSKANTSN
jgi:hypothetical protein